MNRTWSVRKYEFERRYLCRLLKLTNGNFYQAARISGINRTNLYKRVKELNVKLPRELRKIPKWDWDIKDPLKPEVQEMVARRVEEAHDGARRYRPAPP